MYMLLQRLTTAIKLSYQGRQDVADLFRRTSDARAWLETLELSSELRAALVEPLVAVEDGFRELVASRNPPSGVDAAR